MNRHPPGAHELARRMLRQEAGAPPGAGTPAALEGAWLRLSAGLEPLVGRGGADALMARAANLARREFPFLGAVRVTPGEAADMTALRESLASRDAAEAEAAAMAVLERLLGLLTGLLGEDLGLWPARTIWPGAADEAPRSNDGEA